MRRMDGGEMEEDGASFEASVVRLCGEALNAETQRAQRKKRAGKE